jgi:hypothetical protein
LSVLFVNLKESGGVKLENLVCSLKLSKQLEKLGINQKSYFEYFFRPDLDKFEIHLAFKNQIGISAYTVTELSEIIFQKNYEHLEEMGYLNITVEMVSRSEGNFYRITNNLSDHIIDELNQADALAKLFIYLFENKIMELPNET